MEFALANGITQFAEGEPKRRNNDTVRVYQPLEGGNEVSEANVVTLCSKGEIPYCVSRKRPLDGACLGRQLDGESRQGNAEASKNLLNVESPTDPLVRGRLRPSKPLRPSAPSAAAENLLGSRAKLAIYTLKFTPFLPFSQNFHFFQKFSHLPLFDCKIECII